MQREIQSLRRKMKQGIMVHCCKMQQGIMIHRGKIQQGIMIHCRKMQRRDLTPLWIWVGWGDFC